MGFLKPVIGDVASISMSRELYARLDQEGLPFAALGAILSLFQTLKYHFEGHEQLMKQEVVKLENILHLMLYQYGPCPFYSKV